MWRIQLGWWDSLRCRLAMIHLGSHLGQEKVRVLALGLV
jgi:hypothetical protein